MARNPRISTPQELAELASMARNRAPGLSEVTLRVQTDLLLEAETPATEMIAAYETLLGALLPRVDERNAEIVLGKLARWPHLTPGLAVLIRQHRPHLLPALPQDAPADAAAPDQAFDTPEIMEAEAPMPAAAADALIDDGATALPALIAQARRDTALAAELANSVDHPALGLAPLFAHAEPAARTRILAAVQSHLQLAPIATPPRATTEEIARIITLTRTDAVEAAILMATILDGGEPVAAALVTDRDKVLTTLAATALGFEPEETVRMLLVAGDAVSRSTRQVFALSDLARHLTQPVALKLVAEMTGVPVARPAGTALRTHVPQAAPSGTPSRGQPAATERPARKLEWSVHLARPNKAGA